MNIPDLLQFNSIASSLDTVSGNLQRVQEQLATGKRVAVASDDPAAFAQAANLNSQQNAITNDISLGSQIQARLNTIDGALADAGNAITSAIASATQGADASVNTTQMATIGTQVQAALQQLVSSANLQYSGAYVFGGNQTLSAPYSTTGVYSGDTGGNSVKFSNGVAAQLSFDGKSIFGDTATGAIGAMVNLANALSAGNKTGVAAALPALQSALQQVASARGALGSNLQAVNNMITDSNSNSVAVTGAIDSLTGLNVADAAATNSQLQLQQQALVSLASDMAKMPLVNVLA